MWTAERKRPALGWAVLAVAAMVCVGAAPIANATMVTISGQVEAVNGPLVDTGVTDTDVFSAELDIDETTGSLTSLALAYYSGATAAKLYAVASTGSAGVTADQSKGTVSASAPVAGDSVTKNGKKWTPALVDINIVAPGLADSTLDAFFMLYASTLGGTVELVFQQSDDATKTKSIKGNIISVASVAFPDEPPVKVPEPSALMLLALGLLGIGVTVWGRARSNG